MFEEEIQELLPPQISGFFALIDLINYVCTLKEYAEEIECNMYLYFVPYKM